MRFSPRRGIATTVVIIAIVVVIAAAGAGAYFVFTSGGGGSGTTTSQSTTTTTTKSASQSQGSTTTTQTTTTQASSQQTTSTTMTQSCPTTSTVTTSVNEAATIQQTIIPLFQKLSNMTVNYSGTSNGTAFTMTGSYQVESTSSSGGVTTYKVDIVFNSSASSSVTAWVDSSGNVVAVGFPGYNITGSTAQSMFVGFMGPFTIEGTYTNSLQIYQGIGLQPTTLAPQTIGTVNLQMVQYTLSNPPYQFTECGISGTLSEFTLKIGTMSGPYSLVTYMHMVGTVNGESTNFTIQVTWMAAA